MPNYETNVQHAAAALKVGDEASWELARLTFENTYRTAESRRPEQVSLAQWSADVRAASGRRFSESTAQRYRRVWKETVKTSPGGDLPVWAEAYETILESARGSLRERLAESDIRQGMKHATPETKAKILAEMADDPVVVAEAARFGSTTSQALGQLERRRDTLRQEAQERSIESSPIRKLIDQQKAAIDVESACRQFADDLTRMTERFAREIDGALPRTGPSREQPLDYVRRSIARARAALDRLEAYAESGENDLDVFLSGVLGGTH